LSPWETHHLNRAVDRSYGIDRRRSANFTT
jgi:hypothetical protein